MTTCLDAMSANLQYSTPCKALRKRWHFSQVKQCRIDQCLIRIFWHWESHSLSLMLHCDFGSCIYGAWASRPLKFQNGVNFILVIGRLGFPEVYGRPYRANWNNSERRTSNVERRTSGERSREFISKFKTHLIDVNLMFIVVSNVNCSTIFRSIYTV